MILTNVGVVDKDHPEIKPDTSSVWKNDGNLLSLSNLPNAIQNQLVKEENQNDANNNILVVTEQDNLVHNYFYYFECSFDAVDCLSTAIIKLPKMNEENTNYWVTYTGYLLIYLGASVKYDEVNPASNAQTKNLNASNSELSSVTPPTNTENAVNERYFNTQNKLPFFKGKISRVKEKESSIELYVDNIGVRFKQKIPKEFREAYIFNQNVRDTFQAICEFLGVYYICPPKTTTTKNTEDSSELSDEKNIPSEDKNVNKTIKKEKEISKSASDKLKSKSSNNNNDDEDGSEEDDVDEDTSMPQNGYGDISFDANGSIVRGSEVIEESPNMADTLLAMDEMPITGYYEDGDEEADPYILTDLQKFFNGEMFEELHNEVMDYGSITIEPGASGTSDMSSVGGSGAGSESSSDEDSDSDSKSNKKSNKKSKSSSHGSYTARAIRRCFKKSNNSFIRLFARCKTTKCVSNLISSNVRYLKVSKSKALTMIIDAKKADGTIKTNSQKHKDAIYKAKHSGYSNAPNKRRRK